MKEDSVLYVVAHPRRGGGHAVTEWVTDHHEAAGHFGVFCNSLRIPPRTLKPNDYFNIPDSVGKTEDGLKRIEARRSAYDKDFTMITFEDPCKDLSCDAFWQVAWTAANSDLAGEHSRIEYIAVVRDPYNHLASRIAASMRFRNPDAQSHTWKPRCMAWWHEFAKGSQSRVAMDSSNAFTVINYNKWLGDAKLRRALEDKLALPSRGRDNSMSSVSRRGGGSSFEGRKLDGAATQMNVFFRWTSFTTDDRMIELAKNDEIGELAEEMFGWRLVYDGGEIQVRTPKGAES